MKRYTKIIFAAFLFFSAFSVNAQEFSKSNLNGFNSNNDILIYPNPVTNNKFYVKSEKIIKSVEVLDILGKNIKTVHNETNLAYNIFIELEGIKKGMYMIKVTYGKNQSVIQKVILK